MCWLTNNTGRAAAVMALPFSSQRQKNEPAKRGEKRKKHWFCCPEVHQETWFVTEWQGVWERLQFTSPSDPCGECHPGYVLLVAAWFLLCPSTTAPGRLPCLRPSTKIEFSLMDREKMLSEWAPWNITITQGRAHSTPCCWCLFFRSWSFLLIVNLPPF